MYWSENDTSNDYPKISHIPRLLTINYNYESPCDYYARNSNNRRVLESISDDKVSDNDRLFETILFK